MEEVIKHYEEVIISYDKKLMKANQERERLHNIIQEAIDYIEKPSFEAIYKEAYENITDILNILKGSDKE